MVIKIDGTEKEFIIDTGSPVKMIPPEKEILKDPKILPITRKYQDVNKNEVKLTGKITVESKSRGIRNYLPMLVTKREDIKPLLGMEPENYHKT